MGNILNSSQKVVQQKHHQESANAGFLFWERR
nr:MAG TPA: hypothetical protein [Caudoviricetes sp.]